MLKAAPLHFKIIKHSPILQCSVAVRVFNLHFDGLLKKDISADLNKLIQKGLLEIESLSRIHIEFFHWLQIKNGGMNKAYLDQCLIHFNKHRSLWERCVTPTLIVDLEKIQSDPQITDTNLAKKTGEVLQPYLQSAKYWQQSQLVKNVIGLLLPFATLDLKSLPHVRQYQSRLNAVAQKPSQDYVLSAQGNKIQLADVKLANRVWRQGIASWHDYYLLRKHNNAEVNQVLSRLRRHNILNQGCSLTDNSYEITNGAIKTKKEMLDGKVLVKIIKEKDWQKFVKHLSDPNDRPSLRTTINNPTHKFAHMTGKIEPYQQPSDNSNKQHTHTKKTSATWISKELHTPVFGSCHADNRPLVGLAFLKSKCFIKAMLSKDSGTVKHGWIGSKDKVQAYADTIKPYNFTDEKEFQKFIDENNEYVNELLAKLNEEGVLAIVIARNTKEARELARRYRKTIEQTFSKTVPLCFYNPNKKTIKEYTLQEQNDDQISQKLSRPYCKAREQHAKNRMLEIKGKIENKKHWNIGFWGWGGRAVIFKSNSHQKKGEERYISGTAYDILIEIRNAERGELGKDCSPYSWELAEKNIQKLLATRINSPKKSTSQDTLQLYNELLDSSYKLPTIYNV